MLDVPSTSGNHLPTFSQEWFQKMHKCSGLTPFPDHFIVSEETKAKESFYNFYSLNKLPKYPHNVEKMRICTTMEEGDLKVNENLTGQGKKGVILQPLSSPLRLKDKDMLEMSKLVKQTINNESSAETDTLDMDNFKETNPYSGANSTPSHKAYNMNSHLSYPVGVFSSRETESRGPKTELPDINLELPALPASSSDNSDPSRSKTQSLVTDIL